MATHSEMDKFLWELEKLMKKHHVNPLVCIFHPPNTISPMMACAVIGNPSLEWACGAGEEYARHLEKFLKTGVITSRRFPDNLGEEVSESDHGIKKATGLN